MTRNDKRSGLSRREFLQKSTAVAGVSMLGITAASSQSGTCACCAKAEANPITISTVDSNFEREPLVRPFGFKGGYMSEIWQTMAYMQSDQGIGKVGLCTQNVLWSDARVFASHS